MVCQTTSASHYCFIGEHSDTTIGLRLERQMSEMNHYHDVPLIVNRLHEHSARNLVSIYL